VSNQVFRIGPSRGHPLAKALTAAVVEKAKANPDKRREIPDGLLAGLYLIVQPSGSKSWAVRYRRGTKSRKHTLGPYPTLGLREAREHARKALLRVQAGGDPGLDKKIERRRAIDGKDSFEAVARLFIERHLRKKNRSWREAARLLGIVPDPDRQETDDPKSFVLVKNGITARWRDRKVSEIRRADIIALLDDIVDRGAPIVANRTLATLRKLFNWSIERDLIEANPCTGVKPPAAERSRDRVLSEDELRKVWTATDEIGWPFGPIVQLLILTGQRRDEVGAMEWSELDLDKALWTLPRGRVKNDSGHEVPLSPAAVAIIQKLRRINGSKFVFTTTGKTPVSGYPKAKNAMVEKSGVHEWRIHDLRRTVASGLARIGVTLPVIERILNHVSGSFGGIVGVYHRHDYAAEMRAALDSWAREVARIVFGKTAAVVQMPE
jgi:integrase